MATATLAVIRAARPALRHPHDKVAYAVHAAVMARGWSLVATGAAADTDPPPGAWQRGLTGSST
jgi:proteasome inhibitor subunit 1 (PI31)